MTNPTQIDPRPPRQRTRQTTPITPWRRRHREKMRLRAKRQQFHYLLAERARRRGWRQRRKGAGDQRQGATHHGANQ